MSETAFITGGTGGIGEALVRAFAESGRNVAFTYKTNEKKAAELMKRFPGSLALRADVSDSGMVNAAARAAIKRFGKADILINNAGISRPCLFTDITEEQWDNIIDVNLKGCFLSCKAFLPEMISRKRGVIINISSIWGIRGGSCEADYSAAKSGVIGLSKALAKEVGLSGIRVNVIAPGVIDTPMNAHLSAEDMAALKEEIPLNSIGRPEDVARTALFLAGEGGKYITGQVISVCGGMAI